MTSSDQNRVIRSIAAYLVEQIMIMRSCPRDEAVEL